MTDKLAFLVALGINVIGAANDGLWGIDPGFFWLGAVIVWAAYMVRKSERGE